MATDPRDRLRSVLEDLATLLDGVRDEQRRLPTPCSEYDVAALTDHVVGWATTFAAGLANPDGRAPAGPTPVEVDAAGAVRAAAARIDVALAAGAAERPLALGEAAMPGEMAVSMILWEYQVHGWDLAAALDRDWTPDEAGLDASLAFAPAMLTDDVQGAGEPFAPRVPVGGDAPAMDRLVGLSGRDPLWSAGGRASLLAVASMRAQPGRRDELLGLVAAAPVGAEAGCTSYLVATDPADEDVVWVSETWLSRRHHTASLRLPAVREVIAGAVPLLAGPFTGHRLELRGS